MTGTPETVESSGSSENWFKSLIRPVAESFQRNDCNGSAYELGIECALATYLITAFGLKRKQSAFKYSMISFVVVPLIVWPICVARKAPPPKEELKPREL
ncbi:hypothetical protein FOCC_FOCC004204 [Frankliniella occidentalis]|nr:hypothetical protein FOCC_FOCC004204 [Frankliniella occidentalis]